MGDPGKTVVATLGYQVRLLEGPSKFHIDGVEHVIPEGSDCAILVQMWSNSGLVDEKVVGVIGDEYRNSSLAFHQLRRFLNNGGIIGLHRDLCEGPP
jgi:hypothetical protein